MDDLSRNLERLGEAVSDVADRAARPDDLAEARERWQLGSRARRPGSASRRPALLAAAAACLVAAFAVLSVLHRGDRVSFVVGSPPARGDVGAWVAANGEAPLTMRFSEGTSFTLTPGARVRVTGTTRRGATILLERGTVGAAVVHTGSDTQWNLQAGPFEVHVTGTAFDASWDPTGEVFTLAMREGVVVVQGPLLQPGREIRAGEQLRVSVRDGSLELRAGSSDRPAAPPATTSNGSSPETPAAAPGPTAPAPPEGASASPAAPARSVAVGAQPSDDGAASGAKPRAPAGAGAEPTWRDLAAAGKYGEALAAAERAGFAQEIERASSPDLVLLADTARYAAKPALARQALLAQRRRFGVRGSSAFVLGKIAADQQGAAADAVRWFETYLSEEPNGALAEQALGRILELERGDATAERYLARYPHGAHAALARSLLRP